MASDDAKKGKLSNKAAAAAAAASPVTRPTEEVVVVQSNQGLDIDDALRELIKEGENIKTEVLSGGIFLNVSIPMKMHLSKDLLYPTEIGSFIQKNLDILKERINILPYLKIHKICLTTPQQQGTVFKIVSSLDPLVGKMIEANLHYG